MVKKGWSRDDAVSGGGGTGKNCTLFIFPCVPRSCSSVQSETEWQHFLRQCLEVVAKVAELTTAETFQTIVSL